MDNVKKLPLRDFTRYCMSIAQVPSSYLSGLTLEEQLLWLCSFLTNEVIPTVNNNGEAVEELQALYIQLKDYVDNYFDNLDIQEEVDNKLEEMAVSGELADIIAQFVNANCIMKFDKMQDLLDTDVVIEGNIVEVFGNTTLGDGKVEYYFITSEVTDIPLQDNLYAKRIYNEKVDGSYLYDEIEQHELCVENSKSTVQVFKIPHKDKFNKDIVMQHGFADDITSMTPASETATSISNRKNATLCINASIFDVDDTSPNYGRILGLIIHNGVVVSDTRQYYGDPDWYKNRYILGLKNDGILTSYDGNAYAQTLLDDGVVESWQGFIPVLVNGENNRDNLLHHHNWASPTYEETSDVSPIAYKIYYILDNGVYVGQYNIQAFAPGITYYEQTNTSGRYPRQIIAQNENTKDLYILSANGKGKTTNLGTTFEEVITLLKYVDSDVSFAYALDEGGSTETAYKNINRINNTDGQNIYSSQTSGIGTTERLVPDFIYFAKEIETEKDKDINYVLHELQELKQQVNNLSLSNDLNNIIRSDANGVSVENWDKNAPNSLFIGFSQLQNDGTLKKINSIVSNPTNAPGSLNFYDTENSRTVIRAGRDGHILLNEDGSGAAELANIFSKVKTVTECNDISRTGIYFCRGDAGHAPFHDSDIRANVVYHVSIAEDNTIACQLGLFIGGSPSQIAYRCLIEGTTWTAWKYCTIS